MSVIDPERIPHHDPFDRALIAQANVEDLTFLTTDASLQPYASDRIRILL